MSSDTKKTTAAHYEYFKNRFRYWADYIGEPAWRCYFFHQDVGENFARVLPNASARVVRVEFTDKWPVDHRPLNRKSIDETARHEAIHLMVGYLEWIAGCRYMNEGEIPAAVEHLVRKIEEVMDRCSGDTE